MKIWKKLLAAALVLCTLCVLAPVSVPVFAAADVRSGMIMALIEGAGSAGESATPGNLTVPLTRGAGEEIVSVEETKGYFSGYLLIKAVVNDEDGNVPTYNGEAMFRVTNVDGKTFYDERAYYYVVKTTDYNSSLVNYAETTAKTINKNGNANCTVAANGDAVVDINDAQFVFNLYNTDSGVTVTYQNQITAEQLLASDVNGDGKVDIEDCAAAVGKTD